MYDHNSDDENLWCKLTASDAANFQAINLSTVRTVWCGCSILLGTLRPSCSWVFEHMIHWPFVSSIILSMPHLLSEPSIKKENLLVRYCRMELFIYYLVYENSHEKNNVTPGEFKNPGYGMSTKGHEVIGLKINIENHNESK